MTEILSALSNIKGSDLISGQKVMAAYLSSGQHGRLQGFSYQGSLNVVGARLLSEDRWPLHNVHQPSMHERPMWIVEPPLIATARSAVVDPQLTVKPPESGRLLPLNAEVQIPVCAALEWRACALAVLELPVILLPYRGLLRKVASEQNLWDMAEAISTCGGIEFK